jgi:hypothetical protein
LPITQGLSLVLHQIAKHPAHLALGLSHPRLA